MDSCISKTTCILSKVILVDYNILDACKSGRHNSPATSVALETCREFRNNIVALNFCSVHFSKTFTELLQIRDCLKNFGWFNKLEDINKYNQNQKW